MQQKVLLKELYKNTAETTCDLIRNKVTDKITSINTVKLRDKIPSKEIYISLENYWWFKINLGRYIYIYITEIPKTYKLLKQRVIYEHYEKI